MNFTITTQGLREQLLATVVVQERPDLQAKKEALIIESAKNRIASHNVETKILQVLSTSEKNILEDENAINILTSSKTLSEEIQAKQVISASTEIEIDIARQFYIPVANHSATLFFCITELSNIDPMYQYSLTWFFNLFVGSIVNSPKSEDLGSRLESLNQFFTKSIYDNVCRSLFEKDKLVFSLTLCIGILKARGGIDNNLLSFFLTGGVSLDNPHPNPAPEWLTDKSWAEIVRASDLDPLKGLHEAIAKDILLWKDYYDLTCPEDSPFPEPFENTTDLVKLIVLKCLRPDKTINAVKMFIIKHMNQSFVEPPTFDLAASYSDSNPTTPMIFILSPGSDPMDSLYAFARENNMFDK